MTRRITAGALLVLSLLTGLSTALDLDTPLRLYLVVAFVLLAPGWAVAAHLRADRPALEWVTAVGLGVALATLLAQTMVSARSWHPVGAMIVLTVLTAAALLPHLLPGAASAAVHHLASGVRARRWGTDPDAKASP